MERLTLDAEAGEVSAELARRGVGAAARVHVTIELDRGAERTRTLASLNQAGGAFDWLEDEPDLYSDDDLIEPLP